MKIGISRIKGPILTMVMAVGVAAAALGSIAVANGSRHTATGSRHAQHRLHQRAAAGAVPLTTVPTDELNAQGYSLETPQVSARISRQQAEQTAVKGAFLSNNPVREVVLARVISSSDSNANGHTAWVFSMQTRGGTYRSVDGRTLKVHYYVVLVDAETGARLSTFARAS